MNYQEALDNICKQCQSLMSDIKVPYRANEISSGNCGHQLCPYRHIDNSYCDEYMTLQSLINKWTELGCELSNLPFFDDECKLKTIEFIERIYYDK